MTRKDYVLIAEALRLARSAGTGAGHDAGIYDAARVLAETLANDNPRFDSERFLKACGVQS